MPLTPRQDLFARLVAAGRPPPEACVEAGYAPGRARQTAAALLARPDLTARVRGLAPAEVADGRPGTIAGRPAGNSGPRRPGRRPAPANPARRAARSPADAKPPTGAASHGTGARCDPAAIDPAATDAGGPPRSDAAPTDRNWVLGTLRLVVGRCLTGEPVLDRGGQPTGARSSNVTGAIRALELIGRELGMFGERDGAPPTPFAETSDAELDAAIRRLGGEAGFEIRPRGAGAPAGGEPAGPLPPLPEAD